MDILQNLLSKSDLLIVFLGMAAIVWKALDALATLAHILAGQAIPANKGTVLSALLPKASPAAPAPQPSPSPAPAPLPPDVVLDEKFLAFLREQEGFVATAQWDYKQWTNGYGTKAKAAGETIDKAEAEKRLLVEATAAAQFVKSHLPKIPVGIEQAMIDFTFNLGEAWINEPVGKLLAAGNYEDAKSHVLQYVHAGGQVLDALVKRRKAEVEMFDHPL